MVALAPTEIFCQAGLKFVTLLPTIMAEDNFLSRGLR